MRFAASLALLSMILVSSACKQTPASSNAAGASTSDGAGEAAALMQTSRDWAKAAARGNVDEIVSYWSDDAIVLEPNQPALVGKQSIRGMVEASMKIPKFSITWEPEQAFVTQAGDMGYLIEHNRVTLADSTGKVRTMYGKTVTIWRKDADGRWKCVVDTWNDNPTEKVFPTK